MGIQKQEFYEGAALHQLIRGCSGAKIIYAQPLFVFNDTLQVYLKYSTGKRSPWGFTFTPEEQLLLVKRAEAISLVIGLICGADGVATLAHDDYLGIASLRNTALRISCKRNHREHFEVGGPDGTLRNKVAPADWFSLIGKTGVKERL